MTELEQALIESTDCQQTRLLISQILQDEQICEGLCFRIMVVEIIAIIKYLNQIPIENLAVEDQVFKIITQKANALGLDLGLVSLFFKKVVFQSKQVQEILFSTFHELAKEGRGAKLDEFIEQLEFSGFKNKVKIDTQVFLELRTESGLVSEALNACRNLIQKATDLVLARMEKIVCNTSIPHERLFTASAVMTQFFPVDLGRVNGNPMLTLLPPISP